MTYYAGRMPASKRGYITIIALIGVLALGSVYYGTILNAKWVDSSRESHRLTESVLASDFHADAGSYMPGRRFYKTDENMLWWLFMSRNISPLKEMLRFKHSVREFHKYTKDYISQNTPAHIAGAGLDIKQTGTYRRYMNEFRDERNGIVFIIPSFRDIPDSEKIVQESYAEDGAAAFLLPSKENERYYVKDILTDEQEITAHYSTALSNPFFKKKIKLDMPFSQY